MLIPTIKDIIALPEGTTLRAMRGKVKAVGEHKSGQAPGTNEIMTVQELLIEDGTDGVPVKVGNHPDLIGMVNKEIVFLASPKPKGGFTGLKLSLDTKPGTAPYPCVRVSKGATITEAAAFDAANPPQAEVPVPVAQPQLPAQAGHPACPMPAMPAMPAPAPAPIAPNASVIDPRMCRVTTVSYGRTVNTGNFCSDRMDLTVEVGERVNLDDVVNELKARLAQYLPPEFIPPGGRK